VLGETSLERKCRWLFGACLALLISASFWWYGAQTEKLVYDSTRDSADSLVQGALSRIHAGFYEKPSATGLINSWNAFWDRDRKYEWEAFNPNSTDPEKQPKTEEEKQIVAEFLRMQPHVESTTDGGIEEKSIYRDARDTVDGKHKYFYYKPIWGNVADQGGCIFCHQTRELSGLVMNAKEKGVSLAEAGLPPGAKQLELGDLIGVVKIAVNDDKTQKAISWNRAIYLATAIVTVFLAMLAAYVIVRYVIVKPLKHLRDVSEEVARGNTDARAEIETADEFEDLAKAFNKMVRGLVDAHAELRDLNGSLDGKVDELAQLNMRLYEMNRLKSDFLATMSHELRTPLNSIIGFSDVLGSIKSLDDKQKRYVGNIQKSGRMLLEMINDILDLAKIESGKMEVRLSEFRIEHLISAQCDMARPLAERKNIDLNCDIDPDLPNLFQDQGKIQQVLNNLLSNAIKFTPEGGRITVGAKTGPRGDLLLSVADTGVGIAEHDQVTIFEKFRQGTAVLTGGDAMTREYSGTGLGLSIVKELCKLLGGEVYLESELGIGSTFTVRLPWTRADQPKFDSPLDENIDELIRPGRKELQRTMDRSMANSPRED